MGLSGFAALILMAAGLTGSTVDTTAQDSAARCADGCAHVLADGRRQMLQAVVVVPRIGRIVPAAAVHLGGSPPATYDYDVADSSASARWTEASPPTIAPAAGVGRPASVVQVEPPSFVSVVAAEGAPRVTEPMIRQAMADAPLESQQGAVSLPRVQSYVDQLAAGSEAPPIKVGGSIIVDGNHRYIAGRILGQEPAIQPWPGGSAARVVPWWEQVVDPSEWFG